MENVWESITEENGKYFAEADRIYLNNFMDTDKYKDKLNEENKLELGIIPLHYIGDIQNSRILVLSLNPGYNDDYYEVYTENVDKIVNNLNFKNPRFFEFDLYEENKEGYWKKLEPLFEVQYKKALKTKKGIDDDLDDFFKRNISLVEFFPYHSRKYDDCYDKLGKSKEGKKDYLPSQKFLFELIKERLNNSEDDVIIIIARSRSKWFEAIKELKNYSNCYILSNPQNPSFESEHIMKCQFDKGEEITNKIN